MVVENGVEVEPSNRMFYDLMTSDGKRIEVKCRELDQAVEFGHDDVIYRRKTNIADYYVQVLLGRDSRLAVITGFLTHEVRERESEPFRNGKRGDEGYKDIVPHEFLREPERLVDELR